MLIGILLISTATRASAQEVVGVGHAETVDLRTAVAEALLRGPHLRPAVDAVALADLRRDVAASQFSVKITPVLAAAVGPDGQGQRRVGVDVTQRLTFGTDISVSANLQQDGAAVIGQTSGYRATLSQSLLQAFGPARTAVLQDATRAASTARRQEALATQRIILDVARTFYSAVGQERLVEAGDRALMRAKTLRASSEARTKVGLATRLDVLRAELLIAQAEAQLESQRELLADQFDQLKILTGRPLQSTIDVAWHPESASSRTTVTDVDALIPVAASSRLELVEARDRIRDAARSASVARWNLAPDVGVTASYSQQRFATLPSGLPAGVSGDGTNGLGGWQVGVVTTYNLDRAGRVGVAAADIATQAAQRSVVELEQRIEAEVRRAHRAVLRSASTIEIQTRAVELAEQQLRLAQLRYERGLAGNFDVIDAETSVFQAESALIGAEGARELAILALDLAVGTLSPDSLVGGGR